MITLENFKPTENRLLVEIAKEEEITRGGIIIPDTAKEKPSYGYVAKTGPGLKDIESIMGGHIEMDIAIGDKVLFNKYSGTELKIDDKNYILIKETDVLAII